jgi:hypothetical protein
MWLQKRVQEWEGLQQRIVISRDQDEGQTHVAQDSALCLAAFEGGNRLRVPCSSAHEIAGVDDDDGGGFNSISHAGGASARDEDDDDDGNYDGVVFEDVL